MKTVQELVGQIALRASEMGIDVSPKDVGWIVSNFLEAILPDNNPTARQYWQQIADDAAATRDEA